MRLMVPIDRPSATEAVAVARVLSALGVGFAVGPRLLARSGASIVATLAPFGSVLADARLAGPSTAVVAAARTIAGAGADWITLGTGVSPSTVERCASGVRSHGTRIAVVPVPPEADEDAVDLVTVGSGRGRGVSRGVTAVTHLDVDLLGLSSDIGVVAQVAATVGVIVWGAENPADVADARERGAVALILAEEAVDDRDPEGSIRPFTAA